MKILIVNGIFNLKFDENNLNGLTRPMNYYHMVETICRSAKMFTPEKSKTIRLMQ